jgi:hypothetical protein
MAFVIVRAALGLAGLHRKNRLTAAQCLNLTLRALAAKTGLKNWTSKLRLLYADR